MKDPILFQEYNSESAKERAEKMLEKTRIKKSEDEQEVRKTFCAAYLYS